MGERSPTLRDIARTAGISLAATSLALRGSKEVSAATRERVKLIAENMGYRHNPLVAAFQSQLRSRRPSRNLPTIGWIDDQADPGHWLKHAEFQAAKRRAENLGYVLDLIRLDNIRTDDPSGTAARFQRILSARGITGIILPCLHRSHLVGEQWPELAVVSLGQNSAGIRSARVRHSDWTLFNEVGPDVTANIELIGTTLRNRGYRRIGMAIGDFHNRMRESIPSALMLDRNTSLPVAERVPPVVLPMPAEPSKAFRIFETWWKKHRPDAVLISHLEIPDWCRKMGLRIPEDVALAHVERDFQDQNISGIDPAHAMQAEVAIDLLSAQLIRNDRNAPVIPIRALIRGFWVDAGTVKETGLGDDSSKSKVHGGGPSRADTRKSRRGGVPEDPKVRPRR